MSKNNYEAPKTLGEFTICEPVETGCCLRSCGGSPHHMGAETLVSKEITSKFENAIEKD